MHRFLFLLALGLALALGGSPAGAQTLAGRFPTLTGVMQARLGSFPTTGLTKSLRKQKSSVAKCVKALGADDRDLPARAIKNAKKALKAAERAYPGDVDLAPLLDGVVDALRGDILVRGSELFASAQALPEGSARTKAEAKALDSESDVTASLDATGRLERLALLASATKSLDAVEKIVRKAGGGGSLRTELDADIGADHLSLPPASGDYVYTVSYDMPSDAFLLVARGTIGTVEHFVTVRVMSPGVGSRAIQAGPESTYSSSAAAGTFIAMPGANVEFTTWDPLAGKVAGRFDASFLNPMTQTQVDVTNVTFSSTNLLR